MALPLAYEEKNILYIYIIILQFLTYNVVFKIVGIDTSIIVGRFSLTEYLCFQVACKEVAIRGSLIIL